MLTKYEDDKYAGGITSTGVLVDISYQRDSITCIWFDGDGVDSIVTSITDASIVPLTEPEVSAFADFIRDAKPTILLT